MPKKYLIKINGKKEKMPLKTLLKKLNKDITYSLPLQLSIHPKSLNLGQRRDKNLSVEAKKAEFISKCKKRGLVYA